MTSFKIDDPTTDYAKAVVNQEIPACRYVRLACQRHLDDLEKEWDYYFCPESANKFFKFCKFLKHYKGAFSGVSFELEAWQKFIFGNIYGWLDQNKNWRFKNCYIEVPRKNGKTTMASAGACYDSAFVERTGAEVYCVATKEEQAKLLYNDCRAYINQSDELNKVFQILSGRSTVFVNDTGRTSFVKPLGSDSKRLDGLNPLAVYADELHAWQKRELWDVMEDAFGARQNYHMISITTAGYDRNGICYDERNHLIKILENQVQSESKFGIIYTLDEEESQNWQEESNWFKANPNLGVGKELEYMRQQAEKVSQMPSKLNTFLNKQLNVWTDVAEAWLNMEHWNKCRQTFSENMLRNKTCYAGMDLARVNDLSACAYYFPVQDGLDKPHVLVDFFIPNAELRARCERDQVPYDIWAKDYSLTLTEGKTTDWDFIKHSIIQRHSDFNVEKFGYDRHFAGELVSALEKENIELFPFGMGFVSMANPTAELERLVVGNEIVHNGCPILSWNISNTTIRKDPAGNIKPDKIKSVERIDGTVALIIALGVCLERHEEKVNPYANRGLRML